ncbi:hypothetical protein BDK51DRAFT_27141 [Blyttiomyces helicus]|uniref:Uncharacterized protein n=1 Tax=Blyttiomyces helicus TaxID=388810 RepID=A0A4P9VZH8_9FUNG|nr:hypothetical protein BDK51DRAFT_27141 [Blyttiomyces helicus]|eukprot:RKO84732.1 hypothetical protein BDK51DRAFT_27141 [Blyttiomyces helicus]
MAITYNAVVEQIIVPSAFAVQLDTFNDLRCHCQQRLHTYRLWQKALAKLVNQILPKGVRANDEIAYGAARFSSSSPGSAASIKASLQLAIRARGIPMLNLGASPTVGIWQTSCTDLATGTLTLPAAPVRRHRPSWKVRACPGPTIQRDVNAARNITLVFFTLVFSGGTRRGTLFESQTHAYRMVNLHSALRSGQTQPNALYPCAASTNSGLAIEISVEGVFLPFGLQPSLAPRKTATVPMPTEKCLTCRILVDGSPLEEHAVKTEGKKTTCLVESAHNKRFTIQVETENLSYDPVVQ